MTIPQTHLRSLQPEVPKLSQCYLMAPGFIKEIWGQKQHHPKVPDQTLGAFPSNKLPWTVSLVIKGEPIQSTRGWCEQGMYGFEPQLG